MIEWESISLRRGIFWLAVYLVFAVVALGLFFASGLYNVAASDQHLNISRIIIEFILRRSVVVRSDDEPPPDLSDEGLAALGARHFVLGCMPCHGGPSQPSNPIVNQMYPAPPPLDQAAEEWKTAELFWIVSHGLKFTGMPAWAGQGRDDEVWALVAFLERLQDMDGTEFRRLAGESLAQRSQGQALQFANATRATIAFCGSCHGGENRPPASDRVPPLQGQHSAYLRRALEEYRNDRRQSGIMEPIAADLDQRLLAELVEHYSRQPRIAYAGAARPERDTARIGRGREIVLFGAAEGQVPARIACHSGTRSPQFPVLAGMPATYIETQLNVFRAGLRDGTTYGRIMSVIAQRLTPEQVTDAAAYFASVPAGQASAGTAAGENSP